MSFENVLYRKQGSVAWIVLNRPNVLNALNKKLWCEMYQTLDQAEKDEEIRAIILTGSGRAFSSGDDIEEVLKLRTHEDIRAFFFDCAIPTIAKILTLPKPIIAAVNGLAYGGGCEIVMLCDMAVASNNATFAVPEALIGALPPIASVIGPYVIGRLNTSMMILTGEPVSAEDAKLMGLVNKVVSPDELTTAAERIATITMRAAPSSIKVMKKLLNRRFEPKELECSVEELINIVQSDEGREGHKAFKEKRLPNWAKF